MPWTTRSTGTRFSSAEASPGKLEAIAPMSQALPRPIASACRESIASLERPNALMGAFTTFVSPRLLPVFEWPMTIEGRSCDTRSLLSTSV
jgi:hypothetical protein